MSNDPSAFDKDNRNGTLYCMAARKSVYEEFSFISALLLQAVDKEKGIFRRIGVWTDVNPSESIWESSLTYEEGEENYPCEEYRDGYHYIRII